MKSNIWANTTAHEEQEYIVRIDFLKLNVEKVDTGKFSNFSAFYISVDFQQNLWVV